MDDRHAVYAGSFDPPTVGHLWMIRQSAIIFDRLHVALGVNPDKRALFTVDELFGGWAKAHKDHFAEGAIFDKIYTAGEKK